MNDVIDVLARIRKTVFTAEEQDAVDQAIRLLKLQAEAKMPEIHYPVKGYGSQSCDSIFKSGHEDACNFYRPLIARLTAEKEAAEDKVKRMEAKVEELSQENFTLKVDLASLKSRAGVERIAQAIVNLSLEYKGNNKYPSPTEIGQAVSDMILERK